jgi:YD repeat-containing protein
VTLPDGSSTTTAYPANQITVTDAAGKWKTNTTDAFGNLISVTEPNPSGGSNFATTYTYDVANRLKQVSMPRPYNGGTYNQVRSFTWSGSDLTSETTPEADGELPVRRVAPRDAAHRCHGAADAVQLR